MSLIVWLPLNGNINNQGLSGATFNYVNNNGALSVNNSGKIGKCYERTASAKADTLRSSTTFTFGEDISMCCWAYVSGTIGDTANGLVTNHSHVDNTGVGITVKQVSASDYRISCNTGTGSNRTYCTYYGTTNIKNAWHHLCLTYSKSKKQLKLWVDGKAEYTLSNYINASKSDYIDIFNWSTTYYTSGDFRPICKLNDVRVYDHCLSPKEIKEIAKGLVCHYQLKDLYCTNSINKYSGSYAEGNSGGLTKLSNERGYNWKFSYTGTGSDSWNSIRWPYVTFTAGKIYDYSCKVRVNSYTSNISLYFRAARMGNDWVTASINVLQNKGEWKEYHIQLTLAATSDRSGTSYTTQPCIEFYTNSMKTKDAVYSLDIDIKDVQIAETPNKSPVFFSDGSYTEENIYDCSGFGNNGIKHNNILCDSDSPRYKNCYMFSTSGHYKISQPLTAPSQCTISFWVKPTNTSGYATATSNYNNPSSGFWIATNCEGSGLWFYNGGYVISNKGLLNTNAWYHVCLVFNNGIFTWYQNGENAGTTNLSDKSKTLGIQNTISIGNSYTGTSWSTGFIGSISDFRLYATALSDADVKELYGTALSIDETGKSYAYEYIED